MTAAAATAAKSSAKRNPELIRYINLKLAALGQPTSRSTADPEFLEIAAPLLRNYLQKDQLLGNRLCPADTRIQSFLDRYFTDVSPNGVARLPVDSFVLDREGMARIMSLPATADMFSSPCLQSYRVEQGVLHNPKSDKRTTQGLFHIAEGGLPVPADKTAVPKPAFAALWAMALHPPESMLVLPFTADQEERVRCFVSLLLRPLVCPAAGRDPEKTMEIRFIAPGSLVSNLDFVESIFGNAGDPYLPENDAALDAMHWTGHTGCVIVAPHLVGVKKKDIGLPHATVATQRQRRDGMCWEKEDDLYNGGSAFKITCRDQRGVMVTILADNYYGYCKKEVKTQISFAANLFGMCEEEHAGGAIAFATYVLGQDFYAGRTVSLKKAKYDDALCLLGDLVEARPEGYAHDKRFSDIFYVPEDSVFHVLDGTIAWRHGDRDEQLTLRDDATYFLPNGFRIRLEKQEPESAAWQLSGSAAAWNAVSQAVYRVGRRQIGDIEIDRQRAVKGSSVCQRLPSRHGSSG